MQKYLVSLNDLPPDGKDFTLDDQEIWLEPLREFKMDCRVTEPLRMKLKVLPAENGCLVRGSMEGAVVVPCNRCTEDASVEIKSRFDEFEEIPEESAHGHGDGGESHVIYEKHAPMLNLGDVAWEQFMLAMPPTPLCRPECKGLCPQCGANLNLGECGCVEDNGDSRFAALKNFKVGRQ